MGEVTDLIVRKKLQAPSIDSLVLSARTRYLRRFITLRPKALISVLHVSTSDGKMIPWVRMILNAADMLRALDAPPKTKTSRALVRTQVRGPS